MTFIHLRTHTAYSLAEGAIKVKNLVEACKKLNMPAIAMTDTHNLFGAMEFSESLANQGIQPIIGAQLFLRLESSNESVIAPHVVLAHNQIGYTNLSKLLSYSYIHKQEDLFIDLPRLYDHSKGLFLFTGGNSGLLGHLLKARGK